MLSNYPPNNQYPTQQPYPNQQQYPPQQIPQQPYTEHKTSGSSSLNISRTESTSSISNPMRIEYEPENMWFYYQALFDQIKNWVLHYDFKVKGFKTIPVQHTDFEKNTLAKKALFGDKVIDNTMLNDACTGSLPAISYIANQVITHIKEYSRDYSKDDYLNLLYNSKFLFAICVQFSWYNNIMYYQKYLKLVDKFHTRNLIPNNIGKECKESFNSVQLSDVMLPIF